MALAQQQRQRQRLLDPDDLRLLRKHRGLTLRALGARAGVAASTLCMLEQGQRPIAPKVALRLLRVLYEGE